MNDDRDEYDDPPVRRRRKRRPPPEPSGLSYKARDAIRGIFGIVLLLVVGLLSWAGYWWWSVGSWGALRAHMNEYVDLKSLNSTGQVSPVKKYVVVDMATRDLDRLHYDLTHSIRAERPEEVTTIVQIRRQATAVGRYEGGGLATQWTFELAVFDKTTKREIARRTFQGAAPPSSFRGRPGSSKSGDMPIKDVHDFLEGMARQGAGR